MLEAFKTILTRLYYGSDIHEENEAEGNKSFALKEHEHMFRISSATRN